MGFADLLGSTVLGQDGVKLETAEALKGKKAVALYFSAHWCPPCRGFTPQLAEWYKKDLKGKGLEVVFVSGDRDEGSFKEYFGEQPWLSVDFNDKATTEKLNKTFKVKGIPSLVILDGDGKLITTEGRAAVSKDPTGEKLPWSPPKPKDLMEQMKLTGPAGTTTVKEAMAGKSALALYFSAHWCPPCRGFTPQLAEWYKKDLKAKGLEVVFVSSDKDEGQFKEYFDGMPWLALDYSQRSLKEDLSSAFKVSGIPSLVVLDSDFNVVTLEGRGAVSADPTGAELPWHPKPVNNLESGPGNIQEVPTVVVFCETSSDAEKKSIEEAMTTLAKKFIDKQKAEGADFPDVGFMICNSKCSLGERLRSMFGMKALPGAGKTAEDELTQMAIVDIESDGAYYMATPGPFTADAMKAFVDGFQAGSLERKQLS